MDEEAPGFPRVDSHLTPGGMVEGALQGHADPRKKRRVQIVIWVFLALVVVLPIALQLLSLVTD